MIALAALGAVAITFELTLEPSDAAQAVCLALMAVASGCAAIATLRRSPTERNPWLLCWLFLQMGGSASTFAVRAIGGADSYPSVADALWILAGVALVVALVVQIRTDVPVRDPTAVLDATIIATSIGAVLWATVMAPSVSAGPTSMLTQSVEVAYPILDIATLGLLGYLWTATRDRKDLPLLASGVTLLLASDTLFALRSTLGFASKGGLIRPSALLAVMLLAVVVIRGSRNDRITVAPRTRPRSHAWIIIGAAVAPLVLAAVTAFDDWLVPVSELSMMLVVSTALVLAMSCRLVALLGTSGRIATTIQQHRFEALAHASTDVIAIIDDERRFRYVSPTAPTRWLLAPHELVGRPADALVGPKDRALLDQRISRVMARADGAPETVEIDLDPAVAANARAELILVNLLSDPTVEGIGLTVRDVTERVDFERMLHDQAFHDGLTGMANRALFADRLDHALACMRRTPERLSALLFIDLDDFKRVNDSLGHSAGDALLIEISQRICGCTREQDTAARIGGDEFAVLLEDLEHEFGAEEIASRIIACLEKPVSVQGSLVSVTGSIGVRLLDASTTPTVAMRDADLAMYRAKNNGKGRYEIYAPELHAAALASFELRSQLEEAVRNNQLVLYYQTIHELRSRRVVGAEALLRWQHPERGLVLPDDFIPIAEQSGLIIPIGGWTIAQVCSDLAQLNEAARRPLWASVNVSPLQFSAANLTTIVRNALTRARIEANQLRIEITESVFLDESDDNVRVLEELRAMGCRIAIDDFGTGYSSLSYLQRYPIDVVKIDRSFVTDASDDAARLAITESILRLADALHLSCVAEGIESTHDHDLLDSLGCQYGQGFLYSRPMPLDELMLMLAANVEETDRDDTVKAGRHAPFARRSMVGRAMAKIGPQAV